MRSILALLASSTPVCFASQSVRNPGAGGRMWRSVHIQSCAGMRKSIPTRCAVDVVRPTSMKGAKKQANENLTIERRINKSTPEKQNASWSLCYALIYEAYRTGFGARGRMINTLMGEYFVEGGEEIHKIIKQQLLNDVPTSLSLTWAPRQTRILSWSPKKQHLTGTYTQKIAMNHNSIYELDPLHAGLGLLSSDHCCCCCCCNGCLETICSCPSTIFTTSYALVQTLAVPQCVCIWILTSIVRLKARL